MADRKQTAFPGLRVDRLAEAVDAARSRAHAAAAGRAAKPREDPPEPPQETPPPRPEEVPGPAPDAPPEVEPGDQPPEGPPDAPPETPPGVPDQPPEPLRPDEPPEPPAPGEVPPPPSEVPPERPGEVPPPPSEVPGGPGPELPDTGPVEIPDGPTMAAGGLPLPPPLILNARHRVPDRPDRSDPRDSAPRRITAGNVAAALRRDAGRRPAPSPPRPAPVTQRAEAPSLLRLAGVAAVIGGYPILSHVDLRVPRGGITVLAGRAGAGRTATLRTIMGLERASAGEIAFDGEDLTRLSPAHIARSGIAHVPEDTAVFARLTVAQNVALAAPGGPVRRDRLDWIFATFPALERLWRIPAGALSGGQRRMLALACAMAEPRRLYLIDEPARDLPPSVVPAMIQALRDMRRQGGAILLAASDPALAAQVGDLATILEDGRVVWSGPAVELATAPDLLARRQAPAAVAVA